jgi:acetyltransferase-like isoleucine patch superfamily enzyme
MSSTSVNGSIFIPNNTTITSNTWLKAKSIIFGNDITINDGVELVSENNMELPSESTINPNAVLRNAIYSNLDLWTCPDIEITSLQAKDEEINTLCTNNSYRQQVFAKMGSEAAPINNNQKNIAAFSFSLFPNPAQNSIGITMSCDKKENISLTIVDILGKETLSNITFKNIENSALINIDISEMSNGIYFCSLTNEIGNKVVKKFVVAK